MASIQPFTHIAARANASAWDSFFRLTGSSDCLGMIVRRPDGRYFDDADAEPARHPIAGGDDELLHCDRL